jgi:hypothetical protein
MTGRNPALRVNPGGHLKPDEVIGRDAFISSMWRTLERQSVLLTAERRMGKTSVMGKMLAEPTLGVCAVKRSLQGVTSPDEFIRGLLADTEKALPGLLKRSLGAWLQKAGVKRIGISTLSVEFEPTSEQSWKDLAGETFAVLDREPDVAMVFLWDEFPHMIANIRDNEGPLVARALLDLLRAVRETHPTVRMVLSGSLGLHHVVDGLRAQGGMWVPTHDMLGIDLPPLREQDASYLAGELLRNETIACDNPDRVAVTIAFEVGGAPYYVHHVVHQLQERQRAGSCGAVDADLVREIIAEMLRNPLDPWQLQHYIDRIDSYYGEDANVVKAILDVVAAAPGSLNLDAIHSQIGAHLEPPPQERIRDLLVLLCKDYYLGAGPDYAFKLNLVRRSWLARRP